jgi:hypothetical protein
MVIEKASPCLAVPSHAWPCPAEPSLAEPSPALPSSPFGDDCALDSNQGVCHSQSLAKPSWASPCLALPRPARPCLAPPGHATPRSPFGDESGGESNPTQRRPFRFPCLAGPCPAMPCHALPRLAMPCPALPSLALPCRVPLSGIDHPGACTPVPLVWSIFELTLLATKTKTVHCPAWLATLGAGERTAQVTGLHIVPLDRNARRGINREPDFCAANIQHGDRYATIRMG